MTRPPGPSVLFLSYTGLLEPLGRSQVLPYVRGLSRRGYRMSVVSFEKPGWTKEAESPAARLADEGIRWIPRSYHKRPPGLSTSWDAAQAFLLALRTVGGGVRLLHARSHVPALVAEAIRSVTGVPYLFDHRGLMAEEYADAGIWKRGGLAYRLTTSLERRFVRNARRVVVLTERYRGQLSERLDGVSVIPCAVDLERFRPPVDPESRSYDLVYAGAWSGLYLADETLRFLAAYRRRRPEARLLLLVAPGSAVPPVAGVEVRHPRPEEVPELLRLARVGLSLRRPGAAQRAASPVKVSEYLATGLTVVSSAGVGDLDSLLRDARTGAVVDDFSDERLDRAVRELIDLEDPEACLRSRRLAERRYGLKAAIDSYDRIYREILGMS